MFVFKAAVIGPSVTADEIASVIEAAGIAVIQHVVLSDLAPLGDVDFVIATGIDELEAGQELFAELDALTPPHAILAADTASMPITDLGELTARADKVVGFHFAGPATKLRAVEVIEGDYTSAETIRAALGFAQAIKRTAVHCVESPLSVIQRVQEAVAEVSEQDVGLRALVEACRLLEEGVASMREIDAALAGAGIKPPPFQGADLADGGLDGILRRLELLAAEDEESLERFEPPTTLQQLVAAGRTGRAAGQGFYGYPRPDAGYEDSPVKLESRGSVAIAWLDRPPLNSISVEVIQALGRVWDDVSAAGSGVRALVIASGNPNVFCAGADIKGFTGMDADAASEMAATMHALLRRFERSSIITIAAVNGLAFGGGCELAMACDMRIAADSASFGQPEIDLGIIPGFGGTQRLPRLIGHARALEMNLSAVPVGADVAYELGLANRLVPDAELLDVALNLARGLAAKAPRAVELIKQVSGAADLDAGISAEVEAFGQAFGSADGREGVSAFLEKRAPRFTGA